MLSIGPHGCQVGAGGGVESWLHGAAITEPGLLTPLEANMSCGGSVIIRWNTDNC